MLNRENEDDGLVYQLIANETTNFVEHPQSVQLPPDHITYTNLATIQSIDGNIQINGIFYYIIFIPLILCLFHFN